MKTTGCVAVLAAACLMSMGSWTVLADVEPRLNNTAGKLLRAIGQDGRKDVLRQGRQARTMLRGLKKTVSGNLQDPDIAWGQAQTALGKYLRGVGGETSQANHRLLAFMERHYQEGGMNTTTFQADFDASDDSLLGEAYARFRDAVTKADKAVHGTFAAVVRALAKRGIEVNYRLFPTPVPQMPALNPGRLWNCTLGDGAVIAAVTATASQSADYRVVGFSAPGEDLLVEIRGPGTYNFTFARADVGGCFNATFVGAASGNAMIRVSDVRNVTRLTEVSIGNSLGGPDTTTR